MNGKLFLNVQSLQQDEKWNFAVSSLQFGFPFYLQP